MKTRARLAFSDETVAALARQFVEYRLGGCPSGGAVAIQEATRKTAKTHGRSFGELWPMVHAAAYKIIDGDPRSKLG